MAKKVFVSGCYDLLHSGHIEFFKEAAEDGVLAWKMPGAGGGGYLALVVDDAPEFCSRFPEAIPLCIRRGGI